MAEPCERPGLSDHAVVSSNAPHAYDAPYQILSQIPFRTNWRAILLWIPFSAAFSGWRARLNERPADTPSITVTGT